MANETLTRRRVLQVLGTGTVAAGVSTGTAGAVHQTWSATLRPMVDESHGRGNFKSKRVRNHMAFGLQAANLTSDVKMAHIHHTADGGPVVWLYSDLSAHPGDSTERVLDRGNVFGAAGAFTGADLVGHLAGGTLDDLVTAIENGDTFVRVHTAAHLAGEIQGDLG